MHAKQINRTANKFEPIYRDVMVLKGKENGYCTIELQNE